MREQGLWGGAHSSGFSTVPGQQPTTSPVSNWVFNPALPAYPPLEKPRRARLETTVASQEWQTQATKTIFYRKVREQPCRTHVLSASSQVNVFTFIMIIHGQSGRVAETSSMRPSDRPERLDRRTLTHREKIKDNPRVIEIAW
jgi:hypothetical protein